MEGMVACNSNKERRATQSRIDGLDEDALEVERARAVRAYLDGEIKDEITQRADVLHMKDEEPALLQHEDNSRQLLRAKEGERKSGERANEHGIKYVEEDRGVHPYVQQQLIQQRRLLHQQQQQQQKVLLHQQQIQQQQQQLIHQQHQQQLQQHQQQQQLGRHQQQKSQRRGRAKQQQRTEQFPVEYPDALRWVSMEWLETERGGRKLLLDGYVYVKKKTLADGWESYECELRRNQHACKAKIKVLGVDQFREKTEHNHPPDPSKAIQYKVRAGIKRKAVETNESPKQIMMAALSQAAVESNAARQKMTEQSAAKRSHAVNECAAANGSTPAEGGANADEDENPERDGTDGQNATSDESTTAMLTPEPRLPALESMRRYIRKQRQHLKGSGSPRQSRKVDDLEITSLVGEQLVIHDSGQDDPHRFLLFSSERNLRVLSKASAWYADGAVKMFSTLCFHLCTVYTMYSEDDVVPLVYALLGNQEPATYGRFLDYLQAKADLKPASIMVDFDPAAIHAFQEAFPRAEIRECPIDFFEKIDGETMAEENGRLGLL